MIIIVTIVEIHQWVKIILMIIPVMAVMKTKVIITTNNNSNGVDISIDIDL